MLRILVDAMNGATAESKPGKYRSKVSLYVLSVTPRIGARMSSGFILSLFPYEWLI